MDTCPRRAAALLLAAVLAAGGLSACGGGDGGDPAGSGPTTEASGPTTTPSPTATEAPRAPAEAEQVLEFDITDGQASPPLERYEIAQGTSVRIVITSDQPDEIHLHHYDLSATVGPGSEGVIEFVADQTGLFELETHETQLVLAQLEVR